MNVDFRFVDNPPFWHDMFCLTQLSAIFCIVLLADSFRISFLLFFLFSFCFDEHSATSTNTAESVAGQSCNSVFFFAPNYQLNVLCGKLSVSFMYVWLFVSRRCNRSHPSNLLQPVALNSFCLFFLFRNQFTVLLSRSLLVFSKIKSCFAWSSAVTLIIISMVYKITSILRQCLLYLKSTGVFLGDMKPQVFYSMEHDDFHSPKKFGLTSTRLRISISNYIILYFY